MLFRSLAHLLGLPYREGFVKNRYVGRTFIMPGQGVRKKSVRQKLNVITSEFKGRNVLLVDDSIVRGTTSRKIVRIMREGGAREVHLRISCPPTVAPCYYGVDTPNQKELIAANYSIDGIREYVGADSLAYLPLDGLRNAVADRSSEFCTACYTGNYPTKLTPITIEAARR